MGDSGISKSQFVELAVVSQAIKEGLGNKPLFDELCDDDRLCEQLASGFDDAVFSTVGLATPPSGGLDRHAMLRDRVLQALRLIPIELYSLLTTDEGPGKRWLQRHEQRRVVSAFIATQRSDESPSKREAEPDVAADGSESKRSIVDSAIRDSLQISLSDPLLAAHRDTVTRLVFIQQRIRAPEARKLAELDNLKELVFRDSYISETSLRHLTFSDSLRSLQLYESDITDRKVGVISRMRELRRLSLSKTEITDDGIWDIERMSRLEVLHLGETYIGDDGLGALENLDNLHTLLLSDTMITDEGLCWLSALSNLQTLYLTGTPVTDAGIPDLLGLRQLRVLRVDRTQISESGVQTLDQGLPTCAIYY